MGNGNQKKSKALVIAALVFIAAALLPGSGLTAEPIIDPAASQILKKMCETLGGLKQFSVHTQNTVEEALETGQRVDYDIAAEVTVSRPDKLRAERKGDLVDQIFFYDGKTLTLYNPTDKVYATEPAPGTIEEMFDYTRESLGLILPVSNLVYRNAYPLLMQNVNLAMVIGKSVIGGVTCDHLPFSRSGVDFQGWVADSGPSLPTKYVVTDTATPARLSISTVMSDWDMKPSVIGDQFRFVPPKDAKLIEFMPF
jgi:hypothetical protein